MAITAAIFDELGIELMRPSRGALREGVIYDLLGRLSHEDVRERTINALTQRYGAEQQIADTVEQRARTLFLAVRDDWNLQDGDWDLLRWAARTHEIGMSISHKHYNRHGAYLLRNADLPGFSQFEQEILALLVLSHRRKLPVEAFESFADSERSHLLRLVVILRLACLFKYVEQLRSLPDFRVSASGKRLKIRFPSSWLEQHPLTKHELRDERIYLRKLDFKLSIR